MKPHVPLMSDLPQDRLDINEQPFQNTGIDFLGPISIKLSKKNMGKPGKGKMLWCNFYMDECMHACIFTCITFTHTFSTTEMVPKLEKFKIRSNYRE